MSMRETFSTMWRMILWRFGLVSRKDYEYMAAEHQRLLARVAALEGALREIADDEDLTQNQAYFDLVGIAKQALKGDNHDEL